MGNFYLDDETKNNEKKVKEFFPDFNRADFYRQALVNFINENVAGVEQLKKIVEEEKQNQEKSKQRQKHFQNLIDNFEEREKQKVSLKKQKEKLSKKEEKELISKTIININEIFPEINRDFSSDKVLFLAKDFVKQWIEDKNNRLTLTDFLETKGYFKKEIEVPNESS